MSTHASSTTLAELGLFSGQPQFENFAHIKDLLSARAMGPSSRPNELPEGRAIELPSVYEYESTSKDLESFLRETDTAALLVLQDGCVRYERYWLTGGRGVQWISMSVAKSFVSAMVGIAVGENLIGSLLDPVDHYLPQLSNSAYSGVCIKDVLQMSSGARWNEDYNDPDAEIFRLGAALGPGGSLDDFVATLRRDADPGTRCQYNSADTQVLGMLLSSATGRSVADYMHEKLVEPLGVEAPSYWILDGRGREMAFAGLNMTARGFARLGELYRRGGMWGDRQIVPADYVAASVKVTSPHLAPGMPILADHTLPFGYGYQWWLPDGELGEFSAIGVYNQFVYVDPSRASVIVKLSANPAYGLSTGEETNREIETIEVLRAISQQLA